MMIFIQVDTDTKIVTFVHYHPFDEQHGLGKTQEELEQEGILVESIPEPEIIEGKQAILKYNEVNGLYYEYVDTPLTTEEELQQLKERLTLMQQALDELILGGM